MTARRIPARDLDEILEHTANVWRELDGASVLLTGVTGFVGTWLLEALAHARLHTGYRTGAVVHVRSIEHFRERVPHLAAADWITTIVGDIREFRRPPVPVDFVIHAASTVSANAHSANPLGTQDLVVRGTQRVLHTAVECQATRVLLVSSGSVYGRNERAGIGLSESSHSGIDPFQSGRLIAESKRAAEAAGAATAAHSPLDVVIGRGFAMSGPWLPLTSTFALGNFVRDALAGIDIQLTGDGTPVRSYLYGGDVATWLWTLLLRGGHSEVFNVGSEEAISIADLAQLVAGRAGQRVVSVPEARGPSAVDYFVPDTTRARALGLQSRISISTAVDRMLDWYREVDDPEI